MTRLVALTLAFSLLIRGSAAFSASQTLQAAIDAYDKADYQNAMNITSQLLVDDPQNGTLHYYLANAAVHLEQWKDARREYLQCLRLTEDLQLRDYCRQALAAMKDQAPTHRVTQKPQSQPKIFRSITSYPATATKRETTAKLIAGARNTILDERTTLITSAENETRFVEAPIYQRMQNDIDAVPRFIGQGRQVVRNPDYDSTIKEIRNQAKLRLEHSQKELAYKVNKITQYSQSKMAALDSSVASVASQFDGRVSGMQIAPGNGFPFVKNYLYLKPVPPPPFPVTSLPESKKVANGANAL